jgi:hypothetical protein
MMSKRTSVGTLIRLANLADPTVLAPFRMEATQPLACSAPLPARSGGVTSIPSLLDPGQAMTVVNRHFGFAVDWGGKSTFFRKDCEGRIHPCGSDDIANALMNRRVALDEKKTVSLPKFWLTSPERREVDRVVYEPENVYAGHGDLRIYNVWRGFSREARQGKCDLMLQHLQQVICRGNRLHFLYLLRWMAHLVQHPGTAPGVVVVLKSRLEGTGKTTVGQWLCSMFGDHGMMLNTPAQLVGKFNAHLENKSLIVVNEPSWAGDKDAAAKLKSMVTDPTLTIERKHGGIYSLPNVLHFLFTTNADWAVPAGAGARRFFVLDVDPAKAGDADYFNALYAEADNGGIEALLHTLQRVNLVGFSPAVLPITEALREQQEMSLPLHAVWALDLVERADEPATVSHLNYSLGFNRLVSAAALYGDYKGYVADRRGFPTTQVLFGKWLAELGLASTRTAKTRVWTMPSAEEFAQLVRKHAGIHA